MPIFGSCKLCDQTKELHVSHAIGDSIFKKLFQKNSGQAIAIPSGENPIKNTQDSWAEPQLCTDCERLLNEEYEKYSLDILRGKGCNVSTNRLGVTLSGINQHKLMLYFLSIYWRAANSSHPSYEKVIIHQSDQIVLKKAILNNESIPPYRFSIKMHRLTDPTPKGGFSLSQLKEFIVSPFCRIYEKPSKDNVSVCFLFEGFFTEVFLKGLSLKERKMKGVLSKTKSTLLIPYINIFEIKEIYQLLLEGYGKHVTGNSKLKS